jgi:hypothetical protein
VLADDSGGVRAAIGATITPHSAGTLEYPGMPIGSSNFPPAPYNHHSSTTPLLPIQSEQWHKLVLKVGPDAGALSNGITLKLGTGEEGENDPQTGFSLQTPDTGDFEPLTIPANGKIEMTPSSELYQKLTSPEGLTLFLKRDSTVSEFHRLGLDLIPKKSTYLIQRVAALDLPPVDLRDIKDHVVLTDDQAILGWDTSQDIAETNIAWIDAHTSANNAAPRMPQLELRLPGLRQGLTIQSKLEVQYNRGNGQRIFRNQTDDRVRLPADGSYQTVIGDTWHIWDSYSALPFFGGEATLTYRVTEGQNQVLAEQSLRFRIGGRNPEPPRARLFIESLDNAGPQGPLWFAYAIGKTESKDYNGGGSRYNQFWQLPVDANDTTYRTARLTHVGRPVWSNDGNNDAGIPLPGGYGLFQVTGDSTDSEVNIPRVQIWNWQANASAGLAILETKRAIADAWMIRQKNANNANGTVLPNLSIGNVTFSDSTNRTMNGAVAMKAWNGARPIRAGHTDNEGPAAGFIIDPVNGGHFCYWRDNVLPNGWALSRYNRPADLSINPFNYVLRVCNEVE